MELVRRQPEVPHGEVRHTWVIVDELRNAGDLEDLDKLLVEGRSKGACVALGFQDISGLREVFGSKRADEIVGTCANKVFLQNGEGSTIEYASKHFKSQEILETKVSNNTSTGSTDSRGFNVNKQKVMRPVVHEGLLKSLPKPVYGYQGLAGYCDTALVGTEFPYRMEVTHEFLSENLPTPDKSVLGFEERPPEHLTLEEWAPIELTRLGLTGQLKLIGTNSKSPEPPQSGKEPESSTNQQHPKEEGPEIRAKSVLDQVK